MHMVLGIAGPALVILHTNFNLGSLNSRMALFTMLVVVTSGIIGRYLYAHVHKGLYGQQAMLRDIAADVSALKDSLSQGAEGLPDISSELELETASIAKRPGVARGLLSILFSGWRVRRRRRRLVRSIAESMSHSPIWSAVPRRQRRQYIREVDDRLRYFFAAVRKAERLALFDRLFSLWHHLHLPLFVMLALTVTIHIFAVHRY